MMSKLSLLAILFSAILLQASATSVNGKTTHLQMVTSGGVDYCIVSFNVYGGSGMTFAFQLDGSAKQDFMIKGFFDDINRGGSVNQNVTIEYDGSISVGGTSYDKLVGSTYGWTG
jgi:hypothetical protein